MADVVGTVFQQVSGPGSNGQNGQNPGNPGAFTPGVSPSGQPPTGGTGAGIGTQAGVGVCPVFGCIGLSANYHPASGWNWSFDGGPGLAVSAPGFGIGPKTEPHQAGWTSKHKIFGATGISGMSCEYNFGQDFYTVSPAS